MYELLYQYMNILNLAPNVNNKQFEKENDEKKHKSLTPQQHLLQLQLLTLADVLDANFIIGNYEDEQRQAIDNCRWLAKHVNSRNFVSHAFHLGRLLTILKSHGMRNSNEQLWADLVRPAVHKFVEIYKAIKCSKQAPEVKPKQENDNTYRPVSTMPTASAIPLCHH